MDIYDKVRKYIEAGGLLKPGSVVVAGISGGPDSITLLDVLVHLGYRVIAAHLDHRLRPTSQSEAEFVRTTAASYGCKCVIEHLAAGELDGTGTSLEETARNKRYRFLLQTALEFNAFQVVVGHTSDDQVETVLMHLIRGAGPSGLRGMLPKRSMSQWRSELMPRACDDVFLIRPLLHMGRKETINHCQSIGVEPIWDPSNLDQAYFRNRLRYELLPLLETYNSGFRRHLLQTTQLMVEQVEFMDYELERVREFVSRKAGPRSTAFSKERYQNLPTGVQRRLLVDAINGLLPQERNLSYSIVDGARDCALTGKPGRIPLIGDLELSHAGVEFLISARDSEIVFPQFPESQGEKVSQEFSEGISAYDLGHHWSVRSRIIHEPGSEYIPSILNRLHRSRVAFDLKWSEGFVKLRSRKPGDRVSLGREGGRKKVSDLLMAVGIPVQMRDRWPVLESGNELLWVPGIRRSGTYPVESGSENILELELVHSLADIKFSAYGVLCDECTGKVEQGSGCISMDTGTIFRHILLHQGTAGAAEELSVPHSSIFLPLQEWQEQTGLRILCDQQSEVSYRPGLLTELGVQILRSVVRFSNLPAFEGKH